MNVIMEDMESIGLEKEDVVGNLFFINFIIVKEH